MLDLRRRHFLMLLSGGAAAACPLAARAQQPTMPVIGFLNSTSPDWRFTERLRKFGQDMKEQGFVEGENVAILYRFADDQVDRLPELAADLVRRKAAVIATEGPPATFAAQAVTATIPITFLVADDPVRLGLAASISRPGSNMTGINVLNAEVAAKRLELLRDRVPGVTRIAVFVNPADAAMMETQLRDVDTAARVMGCTFRRSTPTPVLRSMLASKSLVATGRMLFLSRQARFLTVGASNWHNWRHSITSRRRMHCETTPKSEA
jgi:putative tryptophan/tyrosine transport system substrate-binding protein